MPSSRAAILTPSPIRSPSPLDDVADVNPDAEFDLSVLGHAGVALNEAVLNLDRSTAPRVDRTTELDDRAVASALDDAPVMGGDGGVDQVAAQPSQGAQGSDPRRRRRAGYSRRHPQPGSPRAFGSRSLRPAGCRHIIANASPSLPVSTEGRSCAHYRRTRHQEGRSPSGRFDPFAAPFGYDRYLWILFSNGSYVDGPLASVFISAANG